MADREDGEQQPVPAAQINFDPVDQQAVKEEQHGAGGQIRPPKQQLAFRGKQLRRTGHGLRRIVQRRADDLVDDDQQKDHGRVKQHLGPGSVKNQNTEDKEQKIAEGGADPGHEGQASGPHNVENQPGKLQQIGDAAAVTVGIGEVHHQNPHAAKEYVVNQLDRGHGGKSHCCISSFPSVSSSRSRGTKLSANLRMLSFLALK